jgi:hypothetical protein
MNDQHENVRREFYLRAIELVEARLDIGDLDKKEVKKGQRLVAEFKRAFAELFLEGYLSMEFVYRDKCVDVWPYWVVAGQPKKLTKAQAHEWLAARGVAWSGSAQELRDAVRKALARGETVPDGCFGLHIERTVKIRTREELNPHLPPEQSYLNPQIPPFIWVSKLRGNSIEAVWGPSRRSSNQD